MEIDKRGLAKQKRSKPDKRDPNITKPVISRGDE
jgi:hypothetical protein